MFTALNHSGSFGKHFVMFYKKAFGLGRYPRPRAQFFSIRLVNTMFMQLFLGIGVISYLTFFQEKKTFKCFENSSFSF